MTQFTQTRILSTDAINAGVKRGRQLRSQAVTEMVGSMFGGSAKDKRHVRA